MQVDQIPLPIPPGLTDRVSVHQLGRFPARRIKTAFAETLCRPHEIVPGHGTRVGLETPPPATGVFGVREIDLGVYRESGQPFRRKAEADAQGASRVYAPQIPRARMFMRWEEVLQLRSRALCHGMHGRSSSIIARARVNPDRCRRRARRPPSGVEHRSKRASRVAPAWPTGADSWREHRLSRSTSQTQPRETLCVLITRRQPRAHSTTIRKPLLYPSELRGRIMIPLT
jgi:hypothetical protein